MNKKKEIEQKKKNAIAVQKLLDQLYPEVEIPLQHRDAYTLLIAVLLSAQCTDKRVNQVTPQLFALADTPQKMAQLTPEQILEIIRPCGLAATKARHIVLLSHLLIERHQGTVPCSFAELEALPGVGHKTASVVMVQAFGQPAFPVDTHIHRCACRWGLSSGKSVEETEKDLKDLYPEASWGKLHLQIILCGREHCRARPHSDSSCTICKALARTEQVS